MFSAHRNTSKDAHVAGLFVRYPRLWRPIEQEGTESPRLSDDYAMRLEDIALELGISRQRTHQLLNSALKKCAKWARARGYQLEDLLPDPRPERDRED